MEDASASGTQQAAPPSNVDPLPIARDSALLGITYNSDIDSYTRFSLGYDALLNGDGNSHMISATLVYRW